MLTFDTPAPIATDRAGTTGATPGVPASLDTGTLHGRFGDGDGPGNDGTVRLESHATTSQGGVTARGL
ncbi:hypothetical protein [Streptomyces sp. NPDC048577]|uniref:hypothetical protein n=1 Tax=Streptomyces sp. NPDC048577 TaxID=3157209 RepID=UPI00343CCA05